MCSFNKFEEIDLSNNAKKVLEGSGFLILYGPAGIYTSDNKEIFYTGSIKWTENIIPFLSGNIIKNTNSSYTSKFRIWYF